MQGHLLGGRAGGRGHKLPRGVAVGSLGSRLVKGQIWPVSQLLKCLLRGPEGVGTMWLPERWCYWLWGVERAIGR